MNEIKRCDTCKKIKDENKCQVLSVMVGKKENCWAWSDDKQWEKKARQASIRYQNGRTM